MTHGRVPLREAFDSPLSKQRYVRRLFTTIADRYDLITVLLSFGLDRRWKRRLVALTPPRGRALDLACGTGDIAFELAARGTAVIGLDVTHRMLELAGRRRTGARGRSAAGGDAAPMYVQGDMVAIPFSDASFDVVTTGYGLRNVPDLVAALREIHRVLRSGGTFASLDFNRPRNPLVRALYLGYLSAVGGVLGWALHRDPDTYRYIPASIRRYPGAQGIVDLLRTEGFAEARAIAVLGGLMTIHTARKRAS